MQGSEWKEGVTPDQDADDEWNEYRRYQARSYFHPFVRRFLFDKQRVRRYHRTDVKHIQIELGHWLTDKYSLCVDVLRCELILFQPNIGVLILEVSTQETLTLPKTHLLLDTFRRLYPPYIDNFKDHEKETWAGGHCPTMVTLLNSQGMSIGTPGKYRDVSPGFIEQYTKVLLKEADGASKDKRPHYPLAAHWRELLSPFICADEEGVQLRVQHLGDDRAPILSWLALDNPRGLDKGNWMRTCFADAPVTVHSPP